jgi:hypothetical protein
MSNCTETYLNTFEMPARFQGNRGTILKEWNLGMTNGQSKTGAVSYYNQGCTEGWRDIEDDKVKKNTTRYLDSYMAPLVGDGYVNTPPSYLESWKRGGPNSVTGYEKTYVSPTPCASLSPPSMNM